MIQLRDHPVIRAMEREGEIAPPRVIGCVKRQGSAPPPRRLPAGRRGGTGGRETRRAGA